MTFANQVSEGVAKKYPTMQAIERTIPLFEDGWDLMPQTFYEPPLPKWEDFDRAPL